MAYYHSITSRIKRAPFRKEDDPKAKVYGPGGEKVVEVDPDVEKGADEIVKRKPSENRCGTQAEKDAGIVKQTCEESGYNKVLEKRKTDPCYNFDCSSVPGSTPKVVGDKCECVKEGQDVETCKEGFTKNEKTGKCEKIEKTPGYEGDLYKTMQGTVKQPWEIRQQARAQTRADRQVNKTMRKMQKYGTFGPDGKFTPNPNLSQREMRKLVQAQSGYNQARQASANVRQDTATGKRAGETYYKGQRRMDQAELGGAGADNQANEEAQKTFLKNKREFDASQANEIVQEQSKQADKAIDPGGPNAFDAVKSSIDAMPKFEYSTDGMLDRVMNNRNSNTYQFGNYSPMFKKRGPLKKKYFNNK